MEKNLFEMFLGAAKGVRPVSLTHDLKDGDVRDRFGPVHEVHPTYIVIKDVVKGFRRVNFDTIHPGTPRVL